MSSRTKLLFHGNFESEAHWSFLGEEWYVFPLWEFLRAIEAADPESFFEALVKEIGNAIFGEIAGYSLGGRLGLELKRRGLRAQKWTFISTHPGLSGNSERAARLKSDFDWSRRVRTLDWKNLFEEWNSQEIFMRSSPSWDTFAPLEEYRAEIAKAFEVLSLAHVPRLPTDHNVLDETVRWICGSEDKKFLKLALDLTGGQIPLHLVSGAGHRIHLENPSTLRELLGYR